MFSRVVMASAANLLPNVYNHGVSGNDPIVYAGLRGRGPGSRVPQPGWQRREPLRPERACGDAADMASLPPAVLSGKVT
jgi:hypothetical protein